MAETNWPQQLGLDLLSDATYYSSVSSTLGSPFGPSLRVGLLELSIDAYVSLNGVPVIALATRSSVSPSEIDTLHLALWNQGLASLLVVFAENAYRIYSLSRL